MPLWFVQTGFKKKAKLLTMLGGRREDTGTCSEDGGCSHDDVESPNIELRQKNTCPTSGKS